MLQGNLSLDVGDFRLNSGEFAIENSGVTAVFGRSGAGKSLLLRAIAGLEPRARGQLSFNGERWLAGRRGLAASRRDVGFVFQDAALFPHLDVRGNLEYARRRAPGVAQVELERIAARVGIAAQLDRAVGSLSGGERQRVAIARALLSRPRLLCMDEPLSALDWRAKGELLNLIETLAADTGLPILYVTHAPPEVERLAARVMFVREGRVERIETLQQALSRADSPLFDEEGPVSVLQGGLGESNAHGLKPFCSDGVQLWLATARTPAEQGVRLRVLARDVSLALDAPGRISILNQLAVTITAITPGSAGRVTVACRLADGQTLLAEITQWSAQLLALRPGLAAYALVKAAALIEG